MLLCLTGAEKVDEATQFMGNGSNLPGAYLTKDQWLASRGIEGTAEMLSFPKVRNAIVEEEADGCRWTNSPVKP